MTSEAFSCLLQRVPGVGDVGKFLQGQGFAPALAVDTGFFQYLGNLFFTHARVLQGVGKVLRRCWKAALTTWKNRFSSSKSTGGFWRTSMATTADVTSGAGMKHFGEISKSIWGFV